MSLQTALVRKMGRYDDGKWAGLVGWCTGFEVKLTDWKWVGSIFALCGLLQAVILPCRRDGINCRGWWPENFLITFQTEQSFELDVNALQKFAQDDCFASKITLLALAPQRLKIRTSIDALVHFMRFRACFFFLMARSQVTLHQGTFILPVYLVCGMAARAASSMLVLDSWYECSKYRLMQFRQLLQSWWNVVKFAREKFHLGRGSVMCETTPCTVTWIMAWWLPRNSSVIKMKQWLGMELDTTVKSKIFHTYEPTRVKWVGTEVLSTT